jgi:hypothetical protein
LRVSVIVIIDVIDVISLTIVSETMFPSINIRMYNTVKDEMLRAA